MANLLDFPLKKIKEGKAEIFVPTQEKISKKLPVFYNPIMKSNRDITILLLQQFPSMNLCDPLAGTGVRSIRFSKELKTKSITTNDLNKRSFALIKKNKKYNKSKFKVCNEDANLFLLNSKGFDYIDVDPFGTSNSYLDAAMKRISRKGILGITNTDTAALSGTYPKTCVRKYWSKPKLDYLMHETGLRILIRKVQLIGMQYDRALTPIFSYFKDHYFRVFFQSSKGKKKADIISEQHEMIDGAGPLWTGKLWDQKLADKIYKQLLKNIANTENNSGLLRFLKIIKEESKINSIGFYDVHKISKKNKLKIMMKKEDIMGKIKKKGHKASSTHFSGTGIRTDMNYKDFIKLLKE